MLNGLSKQLKQILVKAVTNRTDHKRHEDFYCAVNVSGLYRLIDEAFIELVSFN